MSAITGKILPRFILAGGLILVAAVAPAWLRAAESTVVTRLPDDPAAAWAALNTAQQALQPPPEWRTKPPTPAIAQAFRDRVRTGSATLAAQAREFLQRFPGHAQAAEARKIVIRSLSTIAAGNPIREEELTGFIGSIAEDARVPEDERVDMRLMLIRARALRLIPQKGRAAADLEFALGFQALIREFPASEKAFRNALSFARSRASLESTNLARAIAISATAPAELKQLARLHLDGQRTYTIGQPLELRFMAFDGREVDLARLKGKVVLIDFWATWCAPCVEALPELKAAQAKYQGQGLEVIGISFDSDRAAVQRFIKQHDLPWPNYFDGKGWENAFAARFDLNNIPVQWLVDRQGVLREVFAKDNLAAKIEALLKETP